MEDPRKFLIWDLFHYIPPYSKKGGHSETLLNTCIAHSNSADLLLSNVTASSGTAISTDFETLTCSEILSIILIRCVTWHGACDCSFRCFYEIGRYFDNKEQERAKTRGRRQERSQRRQERLKIDSF